MSCNGNRELQKLMLEPKRSVRFYQIITEEPPGEGRLAIPRKFAEKYGNDLPSEVFLEVPTGAVWKVELVKCDDMLWLQNGWREFQEYYSIGYGTFLVFEYTSTSCFHVVICDKSASEIDYCGCHDSEDPKFRGEYDEARTERNGDDNESMEILNNCLPSSKKRKNVALPCPRAAKMARTSSASKSEAKRANKNLSTCKHGENRINKSEIVLRNYEETQPFHRASGSAEIQEFTTLTSAKTLRASEEVPGLKDENPSFYVVLKPSHVKLPSRVTIPSKFAKNHLRKRRGTVVLQISRRKNWNVNFSILRSMSRTARFTLGWFAFVRDNNLETSDVCAFELIDRDKLLLKVVIDRASKRKIAIEPKEKLLLPCPCPAGKTMKAAKSLSSLELHRNVAPIKHLLSRVKSENSAEVMHHSDPKLQSEDTCKGKDLAVYEHEVRRKNPLTADEKAKALSKASGAFKSANPFIMLAMQPAYIGFSLNLPFEFAMRHFKKENGEIILQVSDGRAWTVDYKMRSDRRRAWFARSWSAFVQDNNLAVGDVCIFELIESSKIVLKVTISRAGDADPSFGTISVYEEKPGKGLPERPSCAWLPKAVEAAENFTSIYPSFKVFMGISNLQGKVTVPAKFMKLVKQGTEKASKLRLRVGENTWPVKLTRKCKVGKLRCGWNVFSEANQLQVGDCCVFELVDSESLQLKVSIIRHNG